MTSVSIPRLSATGVVLFLCLFGTGCISAIETTVTPTGGISVESDVEPEPQEEAKTEQIGEPSGPAVLGVPPVWVELDPIEGYGDFSGTPELLIDYVLVTSLQAQCLNDNGYAVAVTPAGNGLDFENLPPDTNNEAMGVAMACLAGLHLPDPVPLTEEQIRVFYDYYLELKDCLAGLGYGGPDPPAFEVFFDTFGDETMWMPFNALPSISAERFDEVNQECPEFPPLERLAATY